MDGHHPDIGHDASNEISTLKLVDKLRAATSKLDVDEELKERREQIFQFRSVEQLAREVSRGKRTGGDKLAYRLDERTTEMGVMEDVSATKECDQCFQNGEGDAEISKSRM